MDIQMTEIDYHYITAQAVIDVLADSDDAIYLEDDA